MKKAAKEKNKKLVLDALDMLFNKRDYAAAERFWSPRYSQHSAHAKPEVIRTQQTISPDKPAYGR
jgi:predicted SnoaL-like aldol condensation-catalyzing enzyme